MGQILKGHGPELKVLGDFKIGPQICYESLFPYFSRKLSHLGTELILNLTNDSWYGTLSQPYQHLYLAAGRAIEFRRPFIRSTNTGISEVILANGNMLKASPIKKQWWHLYHVPYRKNPQATFYQRNPYLTLFFLLIFTSCVFLFLFFDLLRWKKKEGESKTH